MAFVNPVGYGAWVWSWLQPALAGPRRTVVWDLPGTGDSDGAPEDLEVADLAGALEAVLADAGIDRCHLVGAGLGGAVALTHARTSGRARSLVTVGTPPAGDRVDRSALEALGRRETDGSSLAGALSEAFRRSAAEQVDRIRDWRLAEDATGADWTAQADALCAFSPAALHRRTLPALVCHGTDDPVVDGAAGAALADTLPGATYVPLAGRRLAFVESAGALADRVAGFFATVDAATD